MLPASDMGLLDLTRMRDTNQNVRTFAPWQYVTPQPVATGIGWRSWVWLIPWGFFDG